MILIEQAPAQLFENASQQLILPLPMMQWDECYKDSLKNTGTLKTFAEPYLSKMWEYLIIDDLTLDKFYSKKN